MKKTFSERVYGFLWHLLRWPVKKIFAFTCDEDRQDEPALIISNHVTNFDPILVAYSFPGRRFHFVASEHLFRKGLISKVLNFLFEPIARRKGVSGGDTAMACLRKLKAGKSVCIFAEGETTWDGCTAEIFAATGRMAKMSGARLLTYRLEGGYLTAPRWGKGIRRGKMMGRIVGTYSPEELKALSRDEVTALIQRDIAENAALRQKQHPVAYGKRRLAERLEAVIFHCPHCGGGDLHSKGNFLFCACGQKWEYTPFGTFEPAAPFETVAQWDAWQRAELEKETEPTFAQENMTLFELEDGHHQKQLGIGELRLEKGILRCCDEAFPLQEISNMALVQTNLLLFSVGSRYFEVKSPKSCCLRKFLLAWQNTGCAQSVL